MLSVIDLGLRDLVVAIDDSTHRIPSRTIQCIPPVVSDTGIRTPWQGVWRNAGARPRLLLFLVIIKTSPFLIFVWSLDSLRECICFTTLACIEPKLKVEIFVVLVITVYSIIIRRLLSIWWRLMDAGGVSAEIWRAIERVAATYAARSALYWLGSRVRNVFVGRLG